MQGLIRFVGIANVAVWLGAVVFFTVAGGPAFFSAEMANVLPRQHAGRVAEIIIGRLATVQIWCAAIALFHLLAEHLFNGKRVERRIVVGLSVLLTINLAAKFWLLPKMHQLQTVRYAETTTPELKAAAISQFGLLHGLSWIGNLIVIAALGYYLWTLTRPPQPLGRFSTGLR